jgi:PAS domain S-box-containing protein
MAEQTHKTLGAETKKRNILLRILLLIGVVASVMVGCMGYIYYAGNRMAAVHAPLVDAAMEIKLEATTAHLWFEEVISGDRHESIDAVLAHLEEADWYARAMLEGGENPEGKFVPLDDLALREDIRQVRSKLAEFREITLERYNARKQALVGTDIDQRYDAIFRDFVAQADRVETDLQQAIKRQLSNFKMLEVVLIAAWLLITVIVGVVSGRFFSRQIDDELNLQAANEQLRAGEHQLRAANQQLTASELQLKAANQEMLEEIANRERTEYDLRQSEEKYRRFYEDAPLGYQSLDSAGNFLDVNKAWLETLGYSKEEVIGRSFGEFVAPEYVQIFTDKFPRFKAGGKARDREFEMLRKDGTTITVSFDGNVEYDQDGRFKRTHCIMRDVTEERRAQNALRKSEKEYRSVVEDQTEFIVRWLPDGVRTFVNDSYCRYFGKSRDELIGSSFFPLITEEDREKVIKRIEALTPESPVSTADHRVVRADGSTGWNQWTDRALFDEEGRLIEFQSVGRDITERRLAEEALKASKEFSEELIATANAIIVVLQADGKIATFNRFAEELTGYRKEDVLGKNWFDLFVPADEKDALHAVHENVLRDAPEASSYENFIITKNSEKRLISWNNHSVRDNTGQVIGAIAIGVDITEHKLAEEQLVIFKKFAEASGQGLGMSDLDGRIVYCNDALCRIFLSDDCESATEKNIQTYYCEDDKVRLQNEILPFSKTDSGPASYRLFPSTAG